MAGIVFLVPARSGSKGIVDKNIQAVGGKTLLERAIRFCCDYQMSDRTVFISTDSSYYSDLAKGYGASSIGLRSEFLSTDSAKTPDVIVDFLERLESRLGLRPEILVLIQPTSPLRDHVLLDRCISAAMKGKCTSATVSLIEEPHPYKMFVATAMDSDEILMQPLMETSGFASPRQDLPSCFALTGSIYCYWVANIHENPLWFYPKIGVMQEKFVNIDTQEDLEHCRRLFGDFVKK